MVLMAMASVTGEAWPLQASGPLVSSLGPADPDHLKQLNTVKAHHHRGDQQYFLLIHPP